MTPVTKAQWVEALRSGEYEQCTGALMKRTDTGAPSFCCLGVLADIVGAKPTATLGRLPSDPIVLDFGDDEAADGIIPFHIRSLIVSDLNLSTAVGWDPDLSDAPDDIMRTVASMNDRGSSFAVIADYLEKLP